MKRMHQRGTNNSNAKLTDAIVLEIRRKRRGGAKLRELAAEFDISIHQAHMVTSGKAWKHVRPEYELQTGSD